jgi:hypothetical protein
MLQRINGATDTTKDIPDELQSSKRKRGDTDEAIFIPEPTVNIVTDRAQSAFASTRSIAALEDALICDCGATSTLTRSLENCAHVRPKVVAIQTAHGATFLSTSTCLKTYYIRDRLSEI